MRSGDDAARDDAARDARGVKAGMLGASASAAVKNSSIAESTPKAVCMEAVRAAEPSDDPAMPHSRPADDSSKRKRGR